MQKTWRAGGRQKLEGRSGKRPSDALDGILAKKKIKMYAYRRSYRGAEAMGIGLSPNPGEKPRQLTEWVTEFALFRAFRDLQTIFQACSCQPRGRRLHLLTTGNSLIPCLHKGNTQPACRALTQLSMGHRACQLTWQAAAHNFKVKC